MSILSRLYASSGPEVQIHTLHLECPAWAEPILICNGFADQECTLETAETVTFVAAGIDVSLPEKSNRGGASLIFAIDNVLGEAQQRIDEAVESGATVFLTYRVFLDTDKSAPASSPLRLIVRGGVINKGTVQLQAAFFDLINTRWPRDLYTAEFAPGLLYL